jgi:phage-related holin
LFNEKVHIYDWLTVVLCVLVYITGLLAARWQKQVDAKQAPSGLTADQQKVDSNNE